MRVFCGRVLAAAAAAGAVANVAGLSLVRDVLLGVLFVLWTAWWIALFVIYARQKQTTSTIFPSSPRCGFQPGS